MIPALRHILGTHTFLARRHGWKAPLDQLLVQSCLKEARGLTSATRPSATSPPRSSTSSARRGRASATPARCSPISSPGTTRAPSASSSPPAPDEQRALRLRIAEGGVPFDEVRAWFTSTCAPSAAPRRRAPSRRRPHRPGHRPLRCHLCRCRCRRRSSSRLPAAHPLLRCHRPPHRSPRGCSRSFRYLWRRHPIIPTSIIPASMVPASTVPPSLVPPSLLPASIVPASSSPASPPASTTAPLSPLEGAVTIVVCTVNGPLLPAAGGPVSLGVSNQGIPLSATSSIVSVVSP